MLVTLKSASVLPNPQQPTLLPYRNGAKIDVLPVPLFSCGAEEMKWYKRSDQTFLVGSFSEEIEEFWPVQAEIPAWLCGSFSSGEAHKSIRDSPRLLFIRARVACTLQAVLWWLVGMGIGGGVRRALCLLSGRRERL